MYRVRTVFTGVAGSPWYSNLFFSDEGERTAPNAHAAVVTFWTAISTRIADELTCTVEGDVHQINEVTGQTEDVISVTPADVNMLDGDATAGYVQQGLITMRTGVYRGGRPVIGKCFVPGPTIRNFDQDGSLASAYTAQLAAAASALRTAQAGGLIVGWGVWSRPREVVGIEIPGQFCPILSTNVRDTPSILRSRRD